MTAAPPTTVSPWRDAIAAATVVFVVSASGLGVTYAFSRQLQVESVRRELLQVARMAASAIDAGAHARLDDRAKDGGPEYLRVVEPLVALQKAAPEVFYLFTLTPVAPGRYVHGVDTATLFRRPGDTSPRLPLLEPYGIEDPDLDRAVATRAPVVMGESWTEPGRHYLTAYAPFFDPAGRLVGIAEVDMWVRSLDARLAGLLFIARVAFAGLVVLSAGIGVLTFRHRRAAALVEQRDRQAVEDLAAARDAAEAASRAKSEFLATMSHELRTPLNAILGYSELLAEDLVSLGDVRMQRDIDRVAAASRHLTAIIGDILDYAKLDEGVVEAAKPVDVVPMLADLVELLRPGAAARGLDLEVDAASGAAAALADPVRLRQVLLNLMGNAVKFTERGRVRVRVRPTPGRPDRVVVVVHDTGIGIPPEARARVFEPFAQVEASPVRPGTGLGLTISRRLVEAMGGSLRFRSRAGRGSSFRLSIPRAPVLSRAA